MIDAQPCLSSQGLRAWPTRALKRHCRQKHSACCHEIACWRRRQNVMHAPVHQARLAPPRVDRPCPGLFAGLALRAAPSTHITQTSSTCVSAPANHAISRQQVHRACHHRAFSVTRPINRTSTPRLQSRKCPDVTR